MLTFIHDLVGAIARSLAAASAASIAGARLRMGSSLLGLVPQLLFYATHAVVIFTVFTKIKGQAMSLSGLAVFTAIMICVDAVGDALFFEGLWEYCAALRQRNLTFYQTAPAPPILKVLMLRFDLPMVLFGLFFGVTATIYAWLEFSSNPLICLGTIGLGIAAHVVLTSAFHLLQVGFDPNRPLPFGSPASRFYTRPLHLIMGPGVLAVVLTAVFPAYFITGFPAGIASQTTVLAWPIGALTVVGVTSLVVWIIAMNRWVHWSIKRWS